MNKKVLIADDEAVVREGMKTIIDWNEYGFEIFDEASNGIETVQKVLKSNPDLVILDIKMPKLSGIEAVKEIRENNYNGSIIIISGYSDFSFAQNAISYGVDAYLLKPIDEDELIKAIKSVYKKLVSKSLEIAHLDKARNSVISDLFKGKMPTDYDIDAFNLSSPDNNYQVVISEVGNNTEKELNELLPIFKKILCDNTIEMVVINERAIFLLKNKSVTKQLYIVHEEFNKNINPSIKSTIFIAVGRIVHKLEDIKISYNDAFNIDNKRFFCDENELFRNYETLQITSSIKESNSKMNLNKYTEELLSFIEAGNSDAICLTMGNLYNELRFINLSPENIRNFLSNIYIRIKTKINENYKQLNISFPSDEEIIFSICEIPLLNKILQYLKAELLKICASISITTTGTVINKIVYYINCHYSENIKLEALAKMFGYNSTYLGKTFKSTIGESFNAYIERVRIEEAKKLLLTDLKVYEISEKTGFKDIDSFYKKFKKVTGMCPSDFRKETNINS